MLFCLVFRKTIKNINIWRQKVVDVFQFTVDRTIAIVDMFRIGGRYVAGKVRPILVKLSSFWDRRVLLNCTYKLKNYPDKIFIAADESLESRRQNTLDRLKKRALRDGKLVDVVDGILYIEGSAVFSLANGRLAISGGVLS